MSKNNNPIGVFDSGIGGTSIWKEIIKRLPNEDTIYLADSKNAPYGNKTKEQIIDICIKNTQLLLEKGAKIIVVACNTATTNAIDILRNKFNVPFIGIEPAIKPAALATQTKVIGILATKGTLSSELFHKTAQKLNSALSIIEQEGTGLVPLIENNKIQSPEMDVLLKELLTPMTQKNIDHLVLGCSHYPYLITQIQKIIGHHVTIIDSGFAVAKQTDKILTEKKLITSNSTIGNHQLYTNLDIKTLTFFIQNTQHTKIQFLDF